MPQRTNKSSSSKTASKKSSSSKSKSTSSKSQRGRNPQPASSMKSERILDQKTHRNIWGVILIVTAIILFILALIPSQGVVGAFIYTALHGFVGFGCYLLPFFLLGIGISFMVKTEGEHIPTRVAIGFLLIYIALLVILALFSPGVGDGDLSHIFEYEVVAGLGGYAGAGLAFACLRLVGLIATAILWVGVIIVGFAVIGVSISKFTEKIRERREARAEEEREPSPLFARISRSNPLPKKQVQQQQFMLPAYDQGETQAFNEIPTDLNGNTFLLGQNAPAADIPPIEPIGKSAANRQNVSSDQTITRKLGAQVEQKSAASTGKKKLNQAKKAVSSAETMALPEIRTSQNYKLPPMSILKKSGAAKTSKNTEAGLRGTAMALQQTLEDFHIMAHVVGWVAGPTVTLFKVDLPAGVKVAKVASLSEDIALALAAPGVRVFSPIPGTNYVGIEVPNRVRETVLLGDVIQSANGGPLEIPIGKDVDGNSIIADLASMPHLLIAGTTGSGKTIAIHAMIVQILMRATPEQVRFILIDPKRVEFMRYNDIPHLYTPVVTEAKEAASALAWAVAEMERRLKVFSKAGASNIATYNSYVDQGKIEDENAARMPYIVVIIDELADLMMNIGKEVEFSIARIAQLARAAGIHLIVATQRPSADILTGKIKANITNRIALTVATSIDSRVILDVPGAEKLTGRGDLLFSCPAYNRPQRMQGCFVSDDETFQVVDFLKEQGQPDYHQEILKTNLVTMGACSPDGSGGSSNDDPLIWEAADIVVSTQLGSTSNIQRRLKVGYSRAGRIMDMLEEKGIVGPANGSKPRDVLVDEFELAALKELETRDE